MSSDTKNKKFMAGVATAYLYDGNDLFAQAKSLTNSSIQIGNTSEDVRGGNGAGLLGKYYHTSSFDVTLEDALFNLDYIAKSVGTHLQSGANIIKEESLIVQKDSVSGQLYIELSSNPVPFGCLEYPIIFWKKLGESTWNKEESLLPLVNLTASTDVAEADKVCVRYFFTETSAKSMRVSQNFIPSTFTLVLKVNLYSAGVNGKGRTRYGHVEITVPRFQLDGSQDLQMSMTGASTVSLKGTALAVEDCVEECNANSYYATIAEIKETDETVTGLLIEGIEGDIIHTDPPLIPQTIRKKFISYDDMWVTFEDGAPMKLAQAKAKLPGFAIYGAALSDDGITVVSNHNVVFKLNDDVSVTYYVDNKAKYHVIYNFTFLYTRTWDPGIGSVMPIGVDDETFALPSKANFDAAVAPMLDTTCSLTDPMDGSVLRAIYEFTGFTTTDGHVLTFGETYKCSDYADENGNIELTMIASYSLYSYWARHSIDDDPKYDIKYAGYFCISLEGRTTRDGSGKNIIVKTDDMIIDEASNVFYPYHYIYMRPSHTFLHAMSICCGKEIPSYALSEVKMIAGAPVGYTYGYEYMNHKPFDLDSSGHIKYTPYVFKLTEAPYSIGAQQQDFRGYDTTSYGHKDPEIAASLDNPRIVTNPVEVKSYPFYVELIEGASWYAYTSTTLISVVPMFIYLSTDNWYNMSKTLIGKSDPFQNLKDIDPWCNINYDTTGKNNSKDIEIILTAPSGQYLTGPTVKYQGCKVDGSTYKNTAENINFANVANSELVKVTELENMGAGKPTKVKMVIDKKLT